MWMLGSSVTDVYIVLTPCGIPVTGLASEAQKCKRLFVYKRQKKYLIPLYIRVSEISYILYIFYRGYFNLLVHG